ncbi:kinase-like protein, partial [Auricularia subglabra TFB-10046 SS5]
QANVLVTDSGDAALADFGLSTFVEKSESAATTMTAIRNMHTVQFAAPELLLGTDDPAVKPRSKTRESDIYAFGMLIVEVLTEDLPWPNNNPLSVIQKVGNGQIPPRPTLDLMTHSWWHACRRCWTFEPGGRPPMHALLEALKVRTHLSADRALS